MFEVQIYASGSNVAPQGSASQPFDYNSKFAAHKAIDSSNSTFSNTTDSNAWQEVQLNKAVEVEKLVILDRYCQGYADSLGCLCRLSNAMVTLWRACRIRVVFIFDFAHVAFTYPEYASF
jgi:hypothetical protein